jgi:AcrR family transcriptional regulator
MPKTKNSETSVTKAEHHRTAIGQAQRAKTRAWIIHCAIPVFAERGPDAPVIDDFAKAAGVARSTFYTYFQTTRELLDAAVAVLSDEVISSIAPLVAGESDPIIRLATGAWMYYHKAIMDPVFGAFLGSVSSIGPLGAEHARADLVAAIEQGEITILDIDLAESIALGIMVFALRTPHARDHAEERAITVISATLAALGASPPRIRKALRKVEQLGLGTR